VGQNEDEKRWSHDDKSEGESEVFGHIVKFTSEGSVVTSQVEQYPGKPT
jgi:hypothetical protein